MENRTEGLLVKMPISVSPNNVTMNGDTANENPPESTEQKKRKRKRYRPIMPSILYNIYTLAESFPNKFRDRVCAECSWSIPTFYRKMRMLDKVSIKDKTKRVPSISNAEKERIIHIFDEVHAETRAQYDEYRQLPNKLAS